MPIYSLVAQTNRGESLALHQFKGQYILICNTASQCAYTAQYQELQALQERFRGSLVVLAFPSNDFKQQEQGTDEEIGRFCVGVFGVKFPIMMKSKVVGPDKNEIFAWLADTGKNGWNSMEPTWNFCKYLVNPTGTLVGFFESGVSPLDGEIADRIH